MADGSKIEWTDATVNFWWGCTKVGPGCDHCYAEAWAKRAGGGLWGVGVPRRKIKGAVKLLYRLDNGYADWAADQACIVGNAEVFGLPIPTMGPRRRVFIQSMSDLFDTEVPVEWFGEAWDHIERCDRLELQIVTKRLTVIEKRLAAIGRTSWPKHAGLIISVVNQDEADRDIPRLLALKAKLGIPWVGLSMEPLLGPVDLTRIFIGEGANDPALAAENGIKHFRFNINALAGVRSFGWSGLDWVIVGGESGSHARPMHPDWVRSLREQCAADGIPFLFKQWGEWRPQQNGDWKHKLEVATVMPQGGVREWHPNFPSERPTHPEMRPMVRVGKKRAGRLLDGVEHKGVPGVPERILA